MSPLLRSRWAALPIAVLGAFGAGAWVSAPRAVAAQTTPAKSPEKPLEKPKISLVKQLENDRLMVTRITFPPGAREEVHLTPQDLIVMQATPGQVEVTLDKETKTEPVAVGKTWWVSKVTPHAFSNVGTEPFDLIVVFLKDPQDVKSRAK